MARFEILLWLYGPEKFPGISRNRPQGLVVRKPVNANPGLKVNRGNNFSCIKVLSIAFVLCHEKTQVISTASISSRGDFCFAVVGGVIILL